MDGIACRVGAALTVSICLTLGSGKAAADPINASDVVQLVVGGQVVWQTSISETGAGSVRLKVPSVTVDFLEPNGQVSDRLTVNPLYMRVLSASQLTRRPGATLASELFSPLSMTVVSGGVSDTMNVSIGGSPAFSSSVSEPASEKAPDGVMAFQIGRSKFDVTEPGASTVSDYFDINSNTSISFRSDPNHHHVLTNPPPGTIYKTIPEPSGPFTVGMRFGDLVIAEPPSLSLVGIGSLALIGGWLWGRRQLSRAYLRRSGSPT